MNNASTSANVIPLYAVLTIDQRKLLLPQREIHTLESVLDVITATDVPNAIGSFTLAGNSWPVYCLSGQLDLMLELPGTRRICVLLKDSTQGLGLVCDQIEPLGREDLRLQPLPPSMKTPTSPIQALVLRHDAIGCVTTTAHLATLIEQLGRYEDSHGS